MVARVWASPLRGSRDGLQREGPAEQDGLAEAGPGGDASPGAPALAGGKVSGPPQLRWGVVRAGRWRGGTGWRLWTRGGGGGVELSHPRPLVEPSASGTDVALAGWPAVGSAGRPVSLDLQPPGPGADQDPLGPTLCSRRRPRAGGRGPGSVSSWVYQEASNEFTTCLALLPKSNWF